MCEFHNRVQVYVCILLAYVIIATRNVAVCVITLKVIQQFLKNVRLAAANQQRIHVAENLRSVRSKSWTVAQIIRRLSGEQTELLLHSWITLEPSTKQYVHFQSMQCNTTFQLLTAI